MRCRKPVPWVFDGARRGSAGRAGRLFGGRRSVPSSLLCEYNANGEKEREGRTSARAVFPVGTIKGISRIWTDKSSARTVFPAATATRNGAVCEQQVLGSCRLPGWYNSPAVTTAFLLVLDTATIFPLGTVCSCFGRVVLDGYHLPGWYNAELKKSSQETGLDGCHLPGWYNRPVENRSLPAHSWPGSAEKLLPGTPCAHLPSDFWTKASQAPEKGIAPASVRRPGLILRMTAERLSPCPRASTIFPVGTFPLFPVSWKEWMGFEEKHCHHELFTRIAEKQMRPHRGLGPMELSPTTRTSSSKQRLAIVGKPLSSSPVLGSSMIHLLLAIP